MSSEPKDLAHSPCCRVPIIEIKAGMNHANHYRCAECQVVYVWSGTEWVVCQSPDEHLAITRKEAPHVNHTK